MEVRCVSDDGGPCWAQAYLAARVIPTATSARVDLLGDGDQVGPGRGCSGVRPCESGAPAARRADGGTEWLAVVVAALRCFVQAHQFAQSTPKFMHSGWPTHTQINTQRQDHSTLGFTSNPCPAAPHPQLRTEEVALESVRPCRGGAAAAALQPSALRVGQLYELELLQDPSQRWAKYVPAVLVGKRPAEPGRGRGGGRAGAVEVRQRGTYDDCSRRSMGNDLSFPDLSFPALCLPLPCPLQCGASCHLFHRMPLPLPFPASALPATMRRFRPLIP